MKTLVKTLFPLVFRPSLPSSGFPPDFVPCLTVAGLLRLSGPYIAGSGVSYLSSSIFLTPRSRRRNEPLISLLYSLNSVCRSGPILLSSGFSFLSTTKLFDFCVHEHYRAPRFTWHKKDVLSPPLFLLSCVITFSVAPIGTIFPPFSASDSVDAPFVCVRNMDSIRGRSL